MRSPLPACLKVLARPNSLGNHCSFRTAATASQHQTRRLSHTPHTSCIRGMLDVALGNLLGASMVAWSLFSLFSLFSLAAAQQKMQAVTASSVRTRLHLAHVIKHQVDVRSQRPRRLRQPLVRLRVWIVESVFR